VIYTLELGSGGYAADLDGMDAAGPAATILTDARNMRWFDGYAQPMDGHVRLYDPPGTTPLFLLPLRTATGEVRWIYCGATSAHSVDSSGVHTNITRASGGAYSASADIRWSGGTLSGWAIASNPADIPQAWNGDTSTDFANLTGWNSAWRARAVRNVNRFIVAVNLTKSASSYPLLVKWSSSAQPGALPTSWDEADLANDAGEIDLGDADGPLQDVVPLGDLGIVYASNSYHSMQWIGGSPVWRFTRLSGEAGALTTNCVSAFPGGHAVLTNGDVVVHSGGAPQSILTGRNKKKLFSEISSTNFGRAFVVTNEAKSEVWVCYPTQTYCDRALVWNYAANTWSVRDLPNCTAAAVAPVTVSSTGNTWATASGTWDEASGQWEGGSIDASRRRLVIASADGRLFLPETGASFDGTQTPAYCERSGLSFGNPDSIKTITGIRPRVDAPAGTQLAIRIGGSMTPDGSISWSAPLPFTVGTSTGAWGFASGRYLAFRIEGNVGDPWRVRSVDFDYQLAGRF